MPAYEFEGPKAKIIESLVTELRHQLDNIHPNSLQAKYWQSFSRPFGKEPVKPFEEEWAAADLCTKYRNMLASMFEDDLTVHAAEVTEDPTYYWENHEA